MKYVMSENCEHDVKVTFLGKGWGIRVFLNGKINQESFVKHKDEISAEIQRMLRMEDKCGNYSKMADRSRHRKWEKMNKDKE
jgi:hypothetical protein